MCNLMETEKSQVAENIVTKAERKTKMNFQTSKHWIELQKGDETIWFKAFLKSYHIHCPLEIFQYLFFAEVPILSLIKCRRKRWKQMKR